MAGEQLRTVHRDEVEHAPQMPISLDERVPAMVFDLPEGYLAQLDARLAEWAVDAEVPSQYSRDAVSMIERVRDALVSGQSRPIRASDVQSLWLCRLVDGATYPELEDCMQMSVSAASLLELQEAQQHRSASRLLLFRGLVPTPTLDLSQLILPAV